MGLSKTDIEKATYQGHSYAGKDGKPKHSRYVLWDDKENGLGLRVTPQGGKTFVLSYRVRGRSRLMTIGEYGKTVEVHNPQTGRKEFRSLTLHLARRLAGEHKAVIGKGIDPLEEEHARNRPEQDPQTISELGKLWLERHKPPVKKESSWKEDQRRFNKHLKPSLGRLRVERVAKARVTDLWNGIRKQAPFEANRVIVLLATMINYAIDQGYVPSDFRNPAKMSKKALREPPRNRVVKTDEIPKLLEAIEAERDPYVRGLFKLLLFTGLRRSELLNARYSDLDLKAKTLHLPETKSGQERSVPLSDESISIIRSLPRVVGKSHLFPAHNFAPKRKMLDEVTPPEYTVTFADKADVPMSRPKRQWERIRKTAGCPDVRIHDLRRTVSQIVLGRLHPKAAQKLLGHADLSTTLRHYAAIDVEEQREAAGVVASVISGKPSQ